MVTSQEVWTVQGEAFGALAGHIGPKMQDMMEEAGLGGVQGLFLVLQATTLNDNTLSIEHIALRNPYSASARLEEMLSGLVEHGLLTEADGKYTATQKAHDGVDKLLAIQRKRLVELEGYTDVDFDVVNQSLKQVVDSALATTEFDVTNLKNAQRRGIPDDLPKSEKYVRYASYLNALRDDAHLSTWRKHDISGRDWETFTFIWNGEHTSAEALAEQLDFRGHGAEGYQEALDALVARGWIEAGDEAGHYVTTNKGKELRDKVETKTNTYFYSVWKVLSDDQLQQLHTKLTTIRDELRAKMPEPAESA